MTLRNVQKNLAGMEDLLQGINPVMQNRNKEAVSITPVDLAIPVATELALTELDVTRFTLARLVDTTDYSYRDFYYDPTVDDGVASTGVGTWVRRDNTETFDTVADMVASSYLRPGMTVYTKGYYAAGDGGANAYEVVAAGTSTADGGSYIDLATHQAKGLFLDGKVSIVQFGAMLDGVVADDTPATNAAAFATQAVYVPGAVILVDTAVVGSFYSLGSVTVNGIGSISITNLVP